MNYLHNILKKGHHFVTKSLLAIEAVEIREEGKTFFLYNLVLLEKKKQEINILREASGLDLTALNTLLADLTVKGIASILIINSDKIYSNIASNENDDITTIKTAVPGANAEEFYITRYSIGEKKDFISIARESYIKNVLDEINIPFINVAIGPFPLLLSYNLISASANKATDTFIIGSYTFNFNDGELVTFSKTSQQSNFYTSDKTLIFGSKNIRTSILVPFSFGLYYYLDPVLKSFATDETRNNYEQYTFRKIGKLVSISCLAFIFICLAASSILYTTYLQKYNNLELKYSASLAEQQKIRSLNDIYERQLQSYAQLGILGSSKISYLLDQLIYSLPDDVYISKLDVHPAMGRSSENAKFSYKSIFIEGNCFSGNDLNNWINKLKQLNWIKEVTIKQYNQNGQNEIGNFFIEITTS